MSMQKISISLPVRSHTILQIKNQTGLMTKKINGASSSGDAELFWMCDECAVTSVAPPEFAAVSRPASQKTVRAKGIAA